MTTKEQANADVEKLITIFKDMLAFRAAQRDE
jgi:hypothetical protein